MVLHAFYMLNYIFNYFFFFKKKRNRFFTFFSRSFFFLYFLNRSRQMYENTNKKYKNLLLLFSLQLKISIFLCQIEMITNLSIALRVHSVSQLDSKTNQQLTINKNNEQKNNEHIYDWLQIHSYHRRRCVHLYLRLANRS